MLENARVSYDKYKRFKESDESKSFIEFSSFDVRDVTIKAYLVELEKDVFFYAPLSLIKTFFIPVTQNQEKVGFRFFVPSWCLNGGRK